MCRAITSERTSRFVQRLLKESYFPMSSCSSGVSTSRQSAIIEVKTRVQLNVHCCGIPPAHAASAQQVLDAKFIRGTSWLIGQACTLVQD